MSVLLGGLSLMARWLEKFKWARGRFWNQTMKCFKSSQKDPLFYFGSFGVLFFLFITFGSGFLFRGAENVEAGSSPVQSNTLFLASQKSSPPDNFLVMQDSTMKASLPPVLIGDSRSLAVFTVAEEANEDVLGPRQGVVEYIVQSGDTLASVAENFQLSLETLLWANDLSKNSQLKPGQKLIILPVDGVLHHVKEGDTISQLAKTYQANVNDIIAFNQLSGEGDIYIGDILVIPGGKMPKSAPRTISQPTQVAVASSYFICPLGSSCRVTQGLHWYNAVDIDAECGDPIFAAAGGTVLKVARTSSTSRWALNGAGNHLTIRHPNGVVTYYGHFSNALVVPGQEVSQGQMIATVGGMPGTPGAGLSTGCHLHFGVTGAENPFAR